MIPDDQNLEQPSPLKHVESTASGSAEIPKPSVPTRWCAHPQTFEYDGSYHCLECRTTWHGREEFEQRRPAPYKLQVKTSRDYEKENTDLKAKLAQKEEELKLAELRAAKLEVGQEFHKVDEDVARDNENEAGRRVRELEEELKEWKNFSSGWEGRYESALKQLLESEAKREKMSKVLLRSHKHLGKTCNVYFEQNGEPIKGVTDLGEAYMESSLCIDITNALSSTPATSIQARLAAGQKCYEALKQFYKSVQNLSKRTGYVVVENQIYVEEAIQAYETALNQGKE